MLDFKIERGLKAEIEGKEITYDAYTTDIVINKQLYVAKFKIKDGTGKELLKKFTGKLNIKQVENSKTGEIRNVPVVVIPELNDMEIQIEMHSACVFLCKLYDDMLNKK